MLKDGIIPGKSVASWQKRGSLIEKYVSQGESMSAKG